MKLWRLEALSGLGSNDPWVPWYDKAFGFVVRASTESEARTFAARQGGDENPRYNTTENSPWLDEKMSTCKKLTYEGEAGIVIRDFAAA